MQETKHIVFSSIKCVLCYNYMIILVENKEDRIYLRQKFKEQCENGVLILILKKPVYA